MRFSNKAIRYIAAMLTLLLFLPYTVFHKGYIKRMEKITSNHVSQTERRETPGTGKHLLFGATSTVPTNYRLFGSYDQMRFTSTEMMLSFSKDKKSETINSENLNPFKRNRKHLKRISRFLPSTNRLTSALPFTLGRVWEPKPNMPIIYDYLPVLIQAENICQEGIGKQELFLLIMFHSRPGDFKQRGLMRRMPASVSVWHGRIIRHVFLLAETDDIGTQNKILQESERYGDIVQFKFKDSFRNLTLKSSAGLQWVATSCKNARYALKTDQDMAIFPQRIVNFLEKLTPAEENVLYNGGSIVTNPDRTVEEWFRYYISYQEYPYKSYPLYNRGMGYLMSNRVVKLFANYSIRVPRVYAEDVYVGMLAKSVRIKPTCNPDIHFDYTHGGVRERGETRQEQYCSVENLLIFNSRNLRTSWDLFVEFFDKNVVCDPKGYKYKRRWC